MQLYEDLILSFLLSGPFSVTNDTLVFSGGSFTQDFTVQRPWNKAPYCQQKITDCYII